MFVGGLALNSKIISLEMGDLGGVGTNLQKLRLHLWGFF